MRTTRSITVTTMVVLLLASACSKQEQPGRRSPKAEGAKDASQASEDVERLRAENQKLRDELDETKATQVSPAALSPELSQVQEPAQEATKPVAIPPTASGVEEYNLELKDKEAIVTLPGGVKLELVKIPAGEFMMGDESGEAREKPAHKVIISKAFYLGKYEVTHEQWNAVMRQPVAEGAGAREPVASVDFFRWKQFAEEMSKRLSKVGAQVFIPSEAQWEYACRAGTETRYSFGDDKERLTDYAWWRKNTEGKARPVGQKKPNAWGLYDMQGNLYEWCSDWYDEEYYKNSPGEDPPGPESSSKGRVIRGGSWFDDDSGALRSAFRLPTGESDCNDRVGCRVALRIAQEDE